MNGEKYIIKSNKLIEAKGRMTSLEQKFILSLISEIQPTDKDFKDYYINVQDLKHGIGATYNNIYELLKEVANSLMDRKIEIEQVNSKGKKEFLITRYLSSAKYIEGEGCIKVSFDPELKPYLIEIKEMFTQYQLKNVLSLKGSHSIRIYELLKQYEKISKREFDLVEFKRFLGVENEYDRIYDLEKRVLKPAKTEINKHTDLLIDYEKIKKGRKTIGIKFVIETKTDEKIKQIEKLYSNDEIQDIQIKSGLENEKFNSKQVMEIYEIAVLKTYSTSISPFEYIRLNYLNMLEKGTVRHKFSYLKKSLEEDWACAAIQFKFTCS